MNIFVRLDLRSWWIGAYLNTSTRELYVCALWIVLTFALRKREVDF